MGTVAGITLTGLLLVVAPPVMAGQDAAPQERSTLRDNAGALKRDFLLLLSMGLGRVGMWKEASVVSQYLVETADDPFEICVAQAAMVWQMAKAGFYFDATYGEWEKLDRTVTQFGADGRFTAVEKAACRSSYRRVTGDLIEGGMRTSDLRRSSLERIRVLSAAYVGAVQEGVAEDGASPRR
jgi:hypothetical protein